MSKLYYDHLISLDKVEKLVNKISTSKEEKPEMWKLVDEIVHHRVHGCVLEKLPSKHHGKLSAKIAKAPHDPSILDFLREKIKEDVEELIVLEMQKIEKEILQFIQKL